MSEYPTWVCLGCGVKYGKGEPNKYATWHWGTCDICGRERGVTEPRDFGHLKEGWADDAS